jgi:hypothetical protein
MTKVVGAIYPFFASKWGFSRTIQRVYTNFHSDAALRNFIALWRFFLSSSTRKLRLHFAICFAASYRRAELLAGISAAADELV